MAKYNTLQLGSEIDDLIEDLNYCGRPAYAEDDPDALENDGYWGIEYGNGTRAILRNADGFELYDHLLVIRAFLRGIRFAT